MECTATLSGSHVFRSRGPRRAGGLLRCACGLVQPPEVRHRTTLADSHIAMGCECRGDLLACVGIQLRADLKRTINALSYAEENHELMRAELEQLRARIGRSALRILALRAERDALSQRIRRRASA